MGVETGKEEGMSRFTDAVSPDRWILDFKTLLAASSTPGECDDLERVLAATILMGEALPDGMAAEYERRLGRAWGILWQERPSLARSGLVFEDEERTLVRDELLHALYLYVALFPLERLGDPCPIDVVIARAKKTIAQNDARGKEIQ